MKRHEQLQPLSRQHHNGLLAALLLNKGIDKHADSRIMGDFIRDIWEKDLEQHFFAEENFLLPVLNNISFDHSLTDQMLREHEIMRGYIRKLEKGDTDISVIHDFAELLEKHIRFEERVLFPAVEQALNEDQLVSIGRQLNDEESTSCINYLVKFWQ